MKFVGLVSGTALAAIATFTATQANAQVTQASVSQSTPDIIVTAQRKSESLQTVPISVSAVTGNMLEKQQIRTSSDLQLTLPNVTFTKTNFTTASFTIRGIGDLCTGTTCDTATATHINELPLVSTRFYETEYFDMERIEVLRGPQGTLFGRNATSGVVDLITAKPDLRHLGATLEGDYGNYNSKKVKGMINIPLTDTLGIRVAGYYLNRDGEALNIYNNSKIDGRDEYSFRGSLRWKPTPSTTIDLMGSYFREKDDRLRIQKQLCDRDSTGILGCLPDKTTNGVVNGNSQFENLLTSKEFLTVGVSPAFAPFALGSIYGKDVFANATNPADVHTVNTAFTPSYFSDELQLTAHLEQDFGKAKLTIIGGYARNSVDSEEDGDLAVGSTYAGNPGILAFSAGAQGLIPGFPFKSAFATAAAALFPQANALTGTVGNVCTSAPEYTFTGIYGGHTQGCAPTSLKFDRSTISNKQWSVEAHLNTAFEGPLNFLVGGIYVDSVSTQNEYYIDAFQVDYLAALLGAATQAGAAAKGVALPNGYLASPFYDNDENYYHLKSYGIFGEAYYKFSDKVKLTVGLRYAHDQKELIARTTLVGNPGGYVPYGTANANTAITPGDPFADNTVSFGRITGRAVLDYKLSRNHLLYLSYSRGYKSGGINPPLSPIYAVPANFAPETIDAFEVGSKNSFMDGVFHLNASVFYYKYTNLQLAQIVARTAVNQNINADIYGVEAEAIIRPAPGWQFDANASYLHSKIANQLSVNPQDPSGGRSDAVVIKDITNGSNCAVLPTSAATAPIASAIVNGVNASVGLQPIQAIPGYGSMGAFSICNALVANVPSAVATVYQGGVPVNIGGNQIPQAPKYKVSVGAQYTAQLGGGITLTPRFDLAYTGEYYATVYNQPIDKVPAYEVVNAQVQLDGPKDRWFIRGYVQNLTDNSATTGQYVTDQSQGLFTNIFTLEPRRYGVVVGLKF